MQDLKAIRWFYDGKRKVSHDYQGSDINTFSLRELIDRKVEMIGVPARQNRLLIVDVDVEGVSHQHDGREWWSNFCYEYGIPDTYTVQTPSGGYHFYFKIPEAINLDTFSCPAHPVHNGASVLGVDFKFNGWVGSPPTPGYYVIHKDATQIEVLPPSFLAYISSIINGGTSANFSDPQNAPVANLHRPFTQEQIEDLRNKIDWVRVNCTLTREEWRDGIFSLKAGCEDEEELEELVTKWTMNNAYIEGDEIEALKIAEKADRYGSVGPGTIFSIIKESMMRGDQTIRPEGADEGTPWTRDDIFHRAQIAPSFDRQGNIKVEPSESNAAALLGAVYDKDSLYYDIRNDLYVFNGDSYSDSELTNKFLPLIQSNSHGLGLEKFRASAVHRGLDILMATRKRDPHKEFLSNLQWDGVQRIETFFIDYLKVQDNEYHRRVAKNFWVALAARGLNPGCKFDSMLVLEGNEGIRKSSLVEVIAGKGYTFAPLSNRAFEEIDELRKMHQSVIVELPELVGLINRPSEMVKGFLSSSSDSIRDLFARKAKVNKRGFVIVGTTNSDKYLSATMGIRRFWPVKAPDTLASIDTDSIIKVRDQLFAEAVQWFRDGYEYWDMPMRLLSSQTSNRIMHDPLTQCIDGSVMVGESIDVAGVYKRLEALGYVNKGLDRKMAARIETSLQNLGFTESQGIWYSSSAEESQPSFMTQYNNLI
jgi:hypothetical protein